MTTPPRLALELWGASPAALVETARRAEALGYDAVYLGESPTALNAETWTTLGVLAAATDRIAIGPVIANLLSDYRSPALLARQAATLAAASHGRFEFRTGAGATTVAGRRWWKPAGVRYGSYSERWSEADRQLGVLRSLWSGAAVELGGRPFTLDLDHPRVPITVAASGPRGAELVRRHADRWETSFCTPDEWRERRDTFALADRIATALEIDAFVGVDATHASSLWARVANDRAGENVEALWSRALVGTPEEAALRIARLADAGVGQLTVTLHDPDDGRALAAVAEARSLAAQEMAD